jgi:hypothetical protein
VIQIYFRHGTCMSFMFRFDVFRVYVRCDISLCQICFVVMLGVMRVYVRCVSCLC